MIGLPLAVILRDGVEVLVWARRTGGRFSARGSYIQTDGDKIAVLDRLSHTLGPREPVGLHSSMQSSWAHVWAL